MNAQTPDTIAPDTAPGGLDSPGQTIRVARERARLSLDELAAHTRLARSTLEALERDDFGALLEPVYVRGYYRKCAKVLALPEQQLIKAYEARVTPRAPQPPAKLRLGAGGDIEPSRRWGRVLTLAVIGVLLGAAVWYLRQSREPLLPAVLAPPPQAQMPAAVAPLEPAAGPAADMAPANEPLPMPAQAAPATEPAEPGAAAAAAGGQQLLLNFVSTSWARVEDADGRVLLNRVVQSGERQLLDGKPPYSVFLGNAPGVELVFQGQPLDIKGLVKDNATARFSVPLAP